MSLEYLRNHQRWFGRAAWADPVMTAEYLCLGKLKIKGFLFWNCFFPSLIYSDGRHVCYSGGQYGDFHALTFREAERYKKIYNNNPTEVMMALAVIDPPASVLPSPSPRTIWSNARHHPMERSRSQPHGGSSLPSLHQLLRPGGQHLSLLTPPRSFPQAQ